MKVSKAQIRATLEGLVRETGLPLSVEVNSPGDGMTRYRLVRETANGCTRDLGRVSLGSGNFYDAIRLVSDILSEMKRKG